ncbi:transketolase [Treponema primitia]|uniref:transketolase n=1 Tax=Treponema primitia TaxID=88058 RepID=UPI0039809C9E
MEITEKLRAMRLMAVNVRIETIRQMMIIGFGHIGGSMSIADVVGVLYGGAMNLDPHNPTWEDRDKLVCSKGHAGPAIYAALALRGFFPKDWLDTLNQPGTNLPSHCDRTKTPGIDLTTGSLGQGLSGAVGLALATRADGKPAYTYCIVGDGECQEGQIWEAAMVAAQYKLDHLICFIDFNDKQIDGTLEQVNDITNFAERFTAFRWNVYAVDGHDAAAILEAIEKAKTNPGKPSVIVLRTIKGKGCDFVEKMGYNHHILMPRAECEAEIARLQQEAAKIEKE